MRPVTRAQQAALSLASNSSANGELMFTMSPINPPIKGMGDRDYGCESLYVVKGLINLGNSCYLNSVLQCISQCNYLAHHLDLVTIAKDGQTPELALPIEGPITASLSALLKQMRTIDTTASISPGKLLREIALKVPQFAEGDQQDAHELLRSLLEHMQLENISLQQRQLILTMGDSSTNGPNPVSPVKTRAKALDHREPLSVVDTVFSGQLVSLVECQECMTRTHRLEPFLDLP